MADKKKKSTKRRSLETAIVHIKAAFSNTIVTITDLDGNTVAWASAGSTGFKGSRQKTPYSAQKAAEGAFEKVKASGLSKAHVIIRGIGPGREQAVRGLQNAGLELLSIVDKTPIPHNGCRRKGVRRV